jgi:UDP-glucose 4-epimerase
MKRALVTGGAGFIGSHLTERLLSTGNEVLVLDNFSNGDPDNIRHLFGKKGFRLLRGDVRDRVALAQAMQDIDVVFHLAAQIHVDRSIIDPKETLSVNVDGTLAVLDTAMQSGTKEVVIASSSEVYGTALTDKIDESHPLNGGSPYAASKIAADRLAYSYWNTYGMQIAILRAFNTFGPRQKSSGYGGVISIFMERVASGLPPIIYGDGLQTRDYLYIDDTVDAYEAILNAKSIWGQPINVGTGKETTILDISKKICKILRRPDLKPIHIEPRPGEVRRLICDATFAKEKLGFKAKFTLDQGLEKYSKWFPSHGFRQWTKSG